ncbi:MAG: hypothetical protein FJY67_09430 [Calditrichaeota bacterium]|nr:hypothetical protein [Calditrichota bacterium]
MGILGLGLMAVGVGHSVAQTSRISEAIFAAPTQPAPEPFRPSPTGAALRSLALPGWGQSYNRQPLKAVIYGGAEAAFIYGIYRQDQLRAANARMGRSDIAAIYREDRNRLGWYLAGMIILAMVDAFVDAHLYGFDVKPI